MIKTILNNLFSSRSNISVIRAMLNYNVGITGREISRLSGYSPKACHETLTSLEKLNIVKRIRGGRDHIFSLNRKHSLFTNVLLPAFEAEVKYFRSMKHDLKMNLKKYCHSAYIFGSVARNEDTPESDFDLCLVYKNNVRKKILENEIIKLKMEFFEKYGINISPLYFSQNEFINLAKRKKSPVYNILNEGIQLFA